MIKSEHTVTYNLTVSGGNAEATFESPKKMGFFDRIVIFSNAIGNDDIDKSEFSFKSETNEVIPPKTSARFFRKTEYMNTKECGFELDFDVKAQGTQFTLKYEGSGEGKLCVMIFYRDTPYPKPRVVG